MRGDRKAEAHIHTARVPLHRCIQERPNLCELHDLIKHAIVWEEGFIRAPTAPGLGIDFDEELARANPYLGTGLHLEMQEAPCDYLHGNNFLGGAPPPSAAQ